MVSRPGPARVAVVGEFGSGKSSLVNALADLEAERRIPTQLAQYTRHPVELRYGPAYEGTLTTPENQTTPLSYDEARNALTDRGVAAGTLLGLVIPNMRLERVHLIDVPGLEHPDNPGAHRVSRQLVRVSDHILWVTPATQAWKASEEATWERFGRQGEGSLVISHVDLLEKPQVTRLVDRLQEVADIHFQGRLLLTALSEIRFVHVQHVWQHLVSVLHRQTLAKAKAVAADKTQAGRRPRKLRETTPGPPRIALSNHRVERAAAAPSASLRQPSYGQVANQKPSGAGSRTDKAAGPRLAARGVGPSLSRPPAPKRPAPSAAAKTSSLDRLKRRPPTPAATGQRNPESDSGPKGAAVREVKAPSDGGTTVEKRPRGELNMSLDKALADASGKIPECVAAGYVDMSTGMLLGVKTVDSHPQEVLDLVSAATADLFQGQNVVAIEKMFKKSRGLATDDHHYFQEIIVFSDNLIHVFLRCKQNTDHSVTFVCRKSANIGMVIAKSRMVLAPVEAAL